MFEAYVWRSPRVHTAAATASLAAKRGESRRLTFSESASAESDALMDLSSTGLKMLTQGWAPEVDAVLDLELRHPALRGSIQVQGRVKWVNANDDETFKVGLHFEEMRDTTKVALIQLIVLELGSTIYAPSGQVGFIAKNRDVAGSEERFYTVYTPRREKLGTVHQTGAGYALERTDHEGRLDFVTLLDALEFLFPEAVPIRVHPDVRAS